VVVVVAARGHTVDISFVAEQKISRELQKGDFAAVKAGSSAPYTDSGPEQRSHVRGTALSHED
jgi:hypothetical protein